MFKKFISSSLAAAMLLSVAACSSPDSGNSGVSAPSQNTSSTTSINTTDPDANAATDQEIKEIDTSDYAPSGNAGVVKYLGYYDITVDQKGQKQVDIFESELYNGKIEWISASFGEGYYDKLATLIAADDSPDLLTYEPLAFPFGVSRGMYEPLDDMLDMDDPLWASV